MAEKSQEKFKYFAFISYSHKNTREAKWVQEQLERFRLPAKLRQQHPDLPRRLAPVFRDTTDFNTGNLQDIVEENLRQSKYLIVICSPESAASVYVDREVQHFLSLGREKQIIPYIIDGVPGDPARNCYPPSLKHSIIGANAKTDGRWKAFIRVAATMTGVSFDRLWQRQTRRRRVFWINRSVATAVVIACLSGLLWIASPHRSYFRTVTLRYGYPVGISEVTREQRKQLNYYYCITTQLWKVQKVECLNSAGELTQPLVTLLDGASKIVYKDTLNRVEYYDSAGILRYTVKYSSASIEDSLAENSDESLTVAKDYLEAGGGTGSATTLGANSDSRLLDIQDDAFAERSGIVRKLLTFDADGYLIQELYMLDSRNTPGMDSYGNYGIAYTYNENGQVETATFLDRDGNPQDCNLGYAVRRTEYNDLGLKKTESLANLAGKPATDDQGLCREEYTWSAEGNLVQLTNYDTDGELLDSEDADFTAQQIDYDAQGFIVEYRTYGADHKLSPADGSCVTRLTNDETGLIQTVRYFNADGEPAMDSSSSYGIQYTYSGRLVNGFYLLDANGVPVTGSNGVYYTQTEHNDQGLSTGYVFLQKDRTPALNTEENAYRIRMVYENNNMTEYWFLDADGEPMLSTNGACLVRYAYDSNGNMILWAGYGLNNEPVNTAYGYSYFTASYNDQGQPLEQAYFDAKGRPVLVSGAARVTIDYDELARPVVSKNYDENDQLTSALFFTYTEDGTRVTEQAAYTYDENGGQKVAHSTDAGTRFVESFDAGGVLLSREYDDEDGNALYTEYYDAAGNLTQTATFSQAGENDILCTVTDTEGNVLELTHYTADRIQKSYKRFYPDGSLSDYELFNSAGKTIMAIAYDTEGKVTSHINTEYDKAGRMRKVTSLDTGGAVLRSSVYSYADDGSITIAVFSGDGIRQKTTVYNADEHPMEEFDYDGQGKESAHMKWEYDEDERETREVWYTPDGSVTQYGIWFYSDDNTSTFEVYGADRILREVREYDTDGVITLTASYDHYGRLSSEIWFGPDGTGQGHTDYAYGGDGTYSVTDSDADGLPLETVVYDLNDHVIEQIDYDADGAALTHKKQEYDADGRLTRIDRLNADGTRQGSAEFSYAEDGSCVERTYSAAGILVGITRYDAAGHELKSDTWPPV